MGYLVIAAVFLRQQGHSILPEINPFLFFTIGCPFFLNPLLTISRKNLIRSEEITVGLI